MNKYGFFLNKYSLRQLYNMHPDCFEPYRNFCYLVEYILQGLYTLGISYPSGIICFMHFLSFRDFICFKNLCYLVEYILQGSYASDISYPSGTFNNSYRYAHIQFFCNYQVNQNSKWNYIYYRSIYFFIINTRFLQ